MLNDHFAVCDEDFNKGYLDYFAMFEASVNTFAHDLCQSCMLSMHELRCQLNRLWMVFFCKINVVEVT